VAGLGWFDRVSFNRIKAKVTANQATDDEDKEKDESGGANRS